MVDFPNPDEHPSAHTTAVAQVTRVVQASKGGAPVASRPAPPNVPPVRIGGVRYEQDNYVDRSAGDQPGGYLAAKDAETGKRLWRLKVYDIARPSNAHVPDFPLMFRSMKATAGGELEIENESGYRYLVDTTKRTTRIVASPASTPRQRPASPEPKARPPRP